MKASKLFRKYPKTPDFDHSPYRLFERIPAVPGTSNNRGLIVQLPRVILSKALILYIPPTGRVLWEELLVLSSFHS